MYPDFIGIGAQKAGTTWLHRNLQEHPGIWMPKKEVHFFDQKINERTNALRGLFGKRPVDREWRERARRASSAGDLLRGLGRRSQPFDEGWYASLFEPAGGRKTGEITPAYSILDRTAIARVHDLVPEAKILFMVRNPIERDWSQAVMGLDNAGKGSPESFSKERLKRRLDRRGSRTLTNYLGTLENWGVFYPEDRIFVGFLEDVNFAPGDLLGRLHAFLGVEPFLDAGTMNAKIHARSASTMPTEFATLLARTYREDLRHLEQRLGGYAPFWLYCAEQLVENPSESETIPYPLWESHLWEGWLSETGLSEAEARRTRSGTLSSLRVAA